MLVKLACDVKVGDYIMIDGYPEEVLKVSSFLTVEGIMYGNGHHIHVYWFGPDCDENVRALCTDRVKVYTPRESDVMKITAEFMLIVNSFKSQGV